jgi:hypothetical protein
MLIHLTNDISHLIKLSFNTPKFTRGLDALSVSQSIGATPSPNLSAPRENAQQIHFLNFLLCIVPFYLLFFSSYILHRWLQMIGQTTSSTTSLTTLKEARSAVILGIASEEARLAVILGTTKCQCLHVFTLDLYVQMDL